MTSESSARAQSERLLSSRVLWGAIAAVTFAIFFWAVFGHRASWTVVGAAFGFAGGYFAGPEALLALLRFP